VLPRLQELPEVAVELRGDASDYREAQDVPQITVTGSGAEGEQDWFDLAVTVSVAGQEVPFEPLFRALANGEDYLVLEDGTYFRLDHEDLRRLAELIAEARALQDAPGGSVRLSRYAASAWEELAELGVIEGQAAAWHGTVRALATAGGVRERPAPAGLHAQLRPYQLTGYSWLAFLYEHRLGGVLADEMGLGKTLQALALITQVHGADAGSDADGSDPGSGSGTGTGTGTGTAPFLVVAPTSVVHNWAHESAVFAPELSVVPVTATRARRGVDLAEVAAGAHVVITSYTLFRLEYDDYAALPWAGLVLDEAQFVKNHNSRAYQCARRLPAPFKLAITGTPLENNLMELWAMLSITAPGLFANPKRFEEYYRTPIERERDAERLVRLRRRIGPLMLRRTKNQVLTELPDKQEQVVELDLNPRHRKIYQTYLQRERQKVLGLLGDLDGNRFEIFRSLTLLRQAALDVSLVDPKHARTPSTKLDLLMEQLAEAAAEGHRTLVFSQFTRFLDAARQRLAVAGIEHCYLDGKTRKRAEVIEQFRSGDAPVFLISLKAGGFGLNLTEADYVIVLDPWWNPATEAQAVDRVHRIGQTRKVMVYRLVARDTIEEKVMALKARKAALASSVLDDGDFSGARLSADDIRGLLE
jgi:SNF2 family DNA or RNA helicase